MVWNLFQDPRTVRDSVCLWRPGKGFVNFHYIHSPAFHSDTIFRQMFKQGYYYDSNPCESV